MADWFDLIPALLGAAGSAYSMVDQGRARGQERRVYGQQQERYGQQQAAYQQALQQYQLYQQQLQQQYALQQQQFQAQQEAVARQTQEAAAERAIQERLLGGREAIAGRLQDPAQVAAGAQALYHPLSTAAEREIARMTQREMATRGTMDGQYANLMAAQAFAPYQAQLYQQALQAYLNSQGGAVSALTSPQFARSPNAAQVGFQAPQPGGFPQAPGVPTYIPSAAQGGPQDLARLVGNAIRYLAPGQQTTEAQQRIGRDASRYYEPGSVYDAWETPGISVTPRRTEQSLYNPGDIPYEWGPG